MVKRSKLQRKMLRKYLDKYFYINMEPMHNEYMTVDQYNLFQSQLQWYNELCATQQNNYNNLCQAQLEQNKRCCSCKIFKPLTNFHKKYSTPDGLDPQCKTCKKQHDKKYYDNNKDHIKETKKLYYNK